MSATWSPKYLKLASSLLKPASIKQKSTFSLLLDGIWSIVFVPLRFRFQDASQPIRVNSWLKWHKKFEESRYKSDRDMGISVRTYHSVKPTLPVFDFEGLYLKTP